MARFANYYSNMNSIVFRPKRQVFFRTVLFTVLTVCFTVIPAAAQSAARELQNSFRQIAKDVLPVVVQIDTVNIVEKKSFNPFEFFFRFRDNQDERPQLQPFRSQGLGSGVIVERRGNTVYVLTNNHVVDGADEIQITLSDDREFTGELVGGDQLRDLALVSFKTKESIPIAKLGDSDNVWVGDWVLAVGSPLGLDSTVTAGIISAKGRTEGAPGGQQFTDYLQTDASINQGNSGGPLVNLDGEVIGINTFIRSSSGGSIGLGFAIPINNARKDINDFIEKGSVEYAWLGVNMDDVNKVLAEELDLEEQSGAFIYNVYGKSPAMSGGIYPGDLITNLGGQRIRGAGDLTRAVASRSPGKRVSVTLIRDGKTINLNITLSVRTIEKDGNKVNVWPGFTVVPLTSELRDQMDIARSAGKIIIGSTVNNSPASSLGLRSGDVVKSINGRNVKSLKHFYELINDKDRVELKIVRNNQDLEYILNKD
ncbi:MAG: hypothetical protein B0D92_03795 [Spirochaeta sp. LUC14_002_19_P3]|nr:MAG: hypothetical protein B0D92_03795 [Spirochaeta sp. LUC14_002_19_P3]